MRPVLVLIADADNGQHGPDAWTCAIEAIGWATRVHPYAGQMDREMYDTAIKRPVEHQRFLRVETKPEVLDAWRRAAGRSRCGSVSYDSLIALR